MSARPALGRGLNGLIPGTRSSDEGNEPLKVPIDSVDPNPQQPRREIATEALEELASSIREHGLLQPLIVRRNGTRHQLIAGERRLRAARLAGLIDVPVVVSEIADEDLLTVALVENIQREDLSPLDEANAYEQLIEHGLTQEQVARAVGKSRTAVANTLRLLQLPEPVRASLAAGEISEGHARAILGAPEGAARLALLKRVRREGLSVRQTEQAAKRLHAARLPAGRSTLPGDELAAERLRHALGTRVDVRRGRRGGRLVIRWYDDEQLGQLVQALTSRSAPAREPAPSTIEI